MTCKSFAHFLPRQILQNILYLDMLETRTDLLYAISPSAKFITARQKEIALERVRRSNGGRKDHDIKWNQVWEALMDINVWGLFVLSICAYFPNGVLQSVSPYSCTLLKLQLLY